MVGWLYLAGGLVARGEEENVRCIQRHVDGDVIREIRSEQSYLAWLSYNGLGQLVYLFV